MQFPSLRRARDYSQPYEGPRATTGGNGKRSGLAAKIVYLCTTATWTGDLVTWLASVFIVGGIVASLRFYDGKPPPGLPLSLTLNGIFQLLITMAQSLFVISVAQKLGQLKWLWFSEPRPLSHFQVYDEAARGGLWSLGLLLRLSGTRLSIRFLPQLSAIILITSLMTGPVTQQALTSEISLSASTNNGTASSIRATAMSRMFDGNFRPDPSDILSYRRALIDAAYLGPNEEVPQPQPICSSADCTWRSYSSLGICGDLVNITDISDTALLASVRANATGGLLAYYNAYNNTDQDLRTKLGQPLRNIIIQPMVIPSQQFDEATTAATVGEYTIAFSDQLINSTDDLMTIQYQFLNFALYFCTKTFNTSVVGGRHNTTELESAVKIAPSNIQSLNLLWNPDYSDFYQPNSFCPEEVSKLSMVLNGPVGLGEDTKFIIDGCTGLGFSSVIFSIAIGVIVQFEDLSGVVNTGELSYPVSRALYGDFLQRHISDPTTRFQNLQKMVDDMARSLTNTIRANGNSYVGSDGAVRGTVYSPIVVVRVRWEWLSLLLSQVLLTGVVLFSTFRMSRTSGVSHPRDTSVATMCALEKNTRDILCQASDVEDRERRATMINVKLEAYGNTGLLFLSESNGQGNWGQQAGTDSEKD
ncbi:hypothetical protein GQ53DRAFT_845189 [Thozetella sp. PMI_491]|nr:hypothetical protein GQ53DRAFT_845189 [Thozetella sp. PMI_491]